MKYFSLPSEADTSEADTSEADTSEADTSERKMSVMFTIKVLITSLPGGYKPIIDAYNANRPEGLEPIRKASVCEGGFEISLNAEERAKIEKYGRRLDANDYVRQLRWCRGKLLSDGYTGLNKQEVLLLYNALIEALGADKVQQIPYEY